MEDNSKHALLDNAPLASQPLASEIDPKKSSFEKDYSHERRSHWNEVWTNFPEGSRGGVEYRRRLHQVYKHVVPPGQRVLELGCGQGSLLAALEPSYGVGVDFSDVAIEQAKARHPQFSFIRSEVMDLPIQDNHFDYIILSDLVNDVYDVQKVFQNTRKLCHPDTRVILNVYSHLWELPLNMASIAGIAVPKLEQNWLTVADIENLFNLSGFETIRVWQEILLPLSLGKVSDVANRYLVKLPFFRLFALANFMIARPAALPETPARAWPSVSVIVPARNEAGNITEIFRRVPEMGAGTELVFVEGHSHDDTYDAIRREMEKNPHRSCKLFRQSGVGKGDAVRLGFAEASGEILMILDADLTVCPEDLPRFAEALESGHGEFINGVRLVYPMQNDAMRFFNLVGNKFFSLAFSWLLGQRIKDTLCGTKVLWKRDYARIAANRQHFGDFDPFGDFDLLFGAANLSLKIVEMPIRYQARTYGTTNIQRWKHGMLLLRMVMFAARRIKFV